MLISIQHLPKHRIFAALYNNAVQGNGNVSLEEAYHIVTHYKSLLVGKGPLYFDCFNAELFLQGKNATTVGHWMKVDLSFITFHPQEYDKCYGKGKGEEVINNLRKAYIQEVLAYLKPGLCVGLGSDDALFAMKDGVVRFSPTRVVSVLPSN